MAPTPPEVPHLAGRDAALRELGFREREAAWLALVCLHSGVFTRTQFTEHHGCSTKTTHAFVHRLIETHLAREMPLPGTATGLCYTHVYGRGLYRALGIENVRHRREAKDIVLFRRLLSFDHVVHHTDLPWLATEEEKVAHFRSRGVRHDELPSRTYGPEHKRTRRYFALKLPIAADEKSATFVYVDPGRHTDRELQRWASEHRALWTRLRGAGTEVRVAGVALTVGAQHALSRKIAAWQNAPAAAEPLTPEERDTLAAAAHDLRTATAAGNPRPLERWGGLNPCRRLVISLRQRAERAEHAVAASVHIDSYSTHHAQHLGPQSLT